MSLEAEGRDISPAEWQEAEALRVGLAPYYRGYMDHVARFRRETATPEWPNGDPKSPEHPDQMREIGHRYKDIRKACGLTRAEVAGSLNADPILLSAFEGGLVPPKMLPIGFSQNLNMFMRGALSVARKFVADTGLNDDSAPGP